LKWLDSQLKGGLPFGTKVLLMFRFELFALGQLSYLY